jgi:hypothetical protein
VGRVSVCCFGLARAAAASGQDYVTPLPTALLGVT